MGVISYVKEEIQVVRERDPAIKSNMEVFLYSSFKAILHYRIAHKLYLKKHYFLARWVSQRAVRKTGIEIHPGATIGKGLFIDHGSGVIIGETARALVIILHCIRVSPWVEQVRNRESGIRHLKIMSW